MDKALSVSSNVNNNKNVDNFGGLETASHIHYLLHREVLDTFLSTSNSLHTQYATHIQEYTSPVPV